ncbi:MAG: DUF3857 domain-containing protein [Bacteroidales bacterium]|nr:DUF3857 domain-containing protein [Bacteroidales bacterium]
MRRSVLVFLCVALLACTAFAQPAAVVLSVDVTFTMNSPVQGQYDVHERIRVNNQKGIAAATFMQYTDEFRTLSAFSGSISSGGKVLRKLNKKDVSTVLESDALAERVYMNGYEPVAPFPFEVEYVYTVSYRKAIASFPSFIPVQDFDVPVRSATYTLSLPAGTEISYDSSAEPDKQEGKRLVYCWTFRDFPGVSYESSMPSILEFVPYVHACPVAFQYAGTSGTQHNWKEIGTWAWSLMPDPQIPAAVLQEIDARTKDCTSDIQKIRVVYDYLREHTRYVSIQLGIGGHAPLPPARVATSGFGDCKALSFYMQQLLAHLGIASDYVIVNTERRDLPDAYASIGQMNHVILRVPLPRDTLWVECTNPLVPLGYNHEDIAGHQAVAVCADGGEVVRIRDYPDSLRGETERQEIRLAPDGSAWVEIDRKARLDRAERFISFSSLRPADMQQFLYSGLQGHPEGFHLESYSDNFRSYEGEPGYIPEAQVRFSFSVKGLGRVSGDRMFVKAAPFARAMNAQKAERKYDCVIQRSAAVRDSVLILLPEGYGIEHIPEGLSASCPLADFHQEVQRQDQGVLIISEIRTRSGRMAASDYPAYRELVKLVNRAYETTLVLRKEDR